MFKDTIEVINEREYRFDKIQEAYNFINKKIIEDEVQSECIKYLSEYRDMDYNMLRETGVFYAENNKELEFLTSFEDEYQYYLGFQNKFLDFENRHLFPIKNGNGKLLAWIGYDWESSSKYLVGMLGLGDKKRLLFGLDHLSKAYKDDTIIVHEGIFDTLRLREIGLSNGVSLLGKKMSIWQKRFLNRFTNKILIPDGDSAGQEMVDQWREDLTGNVAVIRLQQKERELMYPDEGLRKLIAKDTDALLRASDSEKQRFIDMYEYVLDSLKESSYTEVLF